MVASRWRGTIAYIDGVGENCRKERTVRDLIDLVDPLGSLNITEFAIYKVPLFKRLFSNVVLFHSYVVFKTVDYINGNITWWSIEKNRVGLLFQRRATKAGVLNYKDNEKRVESQYWQPQLVIEELGIKHLVSDLLEYIDKNGELNIDYHLFSANCQIFAKAIFEELAESKWEPNILVKFLTNI